MPYTPTDAALSASLISQHEQASPLHADEQLAADALETTRTAIARWTGGIHLPQMLVPGMVRVSPQARWFANANNGFQEWLSQGGFHQDKEKADEGAPSARRQRNTDAENADACVD